MAGANKLFVLLAASSCVLGSGQFLGPMFTRSFSSSWSSSSSWVPGGHGNMHRMVHEVKTETFRDHGMAVKRTEVQTDCRDGDCQHTMTVQKPGSVMVVSQPAPHAPVRFPCLRSMFRGMSLPMVYVEEREAVALPAPKFLAPRPQPVAVPAPPPVLAKAPVDMPDVTVPLAALAGASTLLAALVAAAVAKRFLGGSREVLLQNLGEPLAPAQEAVLAAHGAPGQAPAVAPPAEPKQVETAPIGLYLQDVYARASAKAEAAAAMAYLCRVYERAAA